MPASLPSREIIGRGDLVEAIVHEEIGPVLQAVVVDRGGVVGVERGDAEQVPAMVIVPCRAPHAFQKPRMAVFRRAGLLAVGPCCRPSPAAKLRSGRRGAALDEVADATVFHRNETGRSRQVELLQPAAAQIRRVVGVTEIDPVEVGLVHAARHELADRHDVVGALHGRSRGNTDEDLLADAVAMLVCGIEHAGVGQRAVRHRPSGCRHRRCRFPGSGRGWWRRAGRRRR